ncbi:MAG: RNA methyltransferase [Candidatus Zixiibacteriota bacterium]|nr:MAG: RNA methyltransferase [candidate division Zixibacteria bacterium]
MPVTRTQIKTLKTLRTGKGRREQGQFLAEGIRLLEEALRHDYRPAAVYYCNPQLTERGRRLLARFRDRAVDTREMSATQLQAVTTVKAPQAMVGVFDIPASRSAELFGPKIRSVVVCESVSDPGNLGTLIRSAVAFRFHLMLLLGMSADPYSPKVVRSTAGAIFGLTILKSTVTELLRLLDMRGFKLIATHRRGVTDMRRLKAAAKASRIMIGVGSESKGLSASMLDRSDLQWRIEHAPAVESLNAAVAGSIIMKQVYDLRR